MVQIIQVRDEELEFPDDMPDAEITAVLAKEYPAPKGFMERTGDDLSDYGESLSRGAAVMGLGIPQAVSEGLAVASDFVGAPETAQGFRGGANYLGEVAANNQGNINKIIERNPVIGTYGSILPQVGQVAGFGTSLPGIMAGGYTMGALSPRISAEQSEVMPKGETALTRALEPLAKYGAMGLMAMGIDPESRGGKGFLQAALGAGTYGVGKTAGVGLKAAGKATNKAVKATVRQATKVNQDAVRALEESGIEPTLQLASDGWAPRSLSNSLSKIPVIGERLNDTLDAATLKLEGNVDKTAGRLGTASDMIEGGRAIQGGLASYFKNTGDRISGIYRDRVAKVLPNNTPAVTAPAETFFSKYLNRYSDAPNVGGGMLEIAPLARNFLADTTPVPIASRTSGGSGSMTVPLTSRIGSAGERLQTTTQMPFSYGGRSVNAIDPITGKAITTKPQMTFNTLKNLRTDIGEIAGRQDAPAAYKQAYGALSDSMEATAKAVSPEAVKELAIANRYTRMTKNTQSKLKRFFTANPDGTYKMAPEVASKASRTELETLKRAIPKEDFDNYTSAVIRDMGLATEGAQDATGQVFSPNTFLTRYTKLNKSGKANVLFDKETATELQRAAAVADRFKNLGKAMNFSNTTNNFVTAGAVAALLFDTTTAGAIGGSTYALTRLLTSPKALRVINNYAYKPVIKNPKVRASFTDRLTAAAGEDPELQREVQIYLNNLTGMAAAAEAPLSKLPNITKTIDEAEFVPLPPKPKVDFLNMAPKPELPANPRGSQ